MGATKPALLRALAAAAVWGKVGARCGDGGAGVYPDDGVAAAARFAPRAKGHMPNDKVKAALESLTSAEVVRRALEALRDDTDKEAERDNDNKEEPSCDSKDDGFVITQDDNTEDDKTSGGEAPKVQRASGQKAHQQTNRGGGMLGLASDGEDGKTRNSKASPGRRAANEDRNARALKARQGSQALDASKSHQKTKEAAHHPAYWGSGTHRRALEGEDEKDWAPKAKKAEKQIPGCRPRRPHMPRRSPTTWPTRAVGHAAPRGGRHCLAWRRCLGLPLAAKIRGKPDRA